MATTAIPANCVAVNTALLKDEARLTDGMWERASLARPIIRLQSKTRGEYMLGAGIAQSSIRFERSFAPFTSGDGAPPTTGNSATDPWGATANIAVSDGADVNGCRPPTDSVRFGQTSFDIVPKHYALNTQDFCIRDIQFGHQYAEWMEKVSSAIDTIPQEVWARRFTFDYVRTVALASHMVTLNTTSGTLESTSYNTSSIANGRLRQGILDKYYGKMMRNGASKPSGIDEATGSPVFTLITSAETSADIVRGDPELRNDNRWAFSGSKGEFTPLVPGIPFRKRNYGGFIHEIDPTPRRFIFTGSAYLEIAPWIESTTSKGYKWETNPAWEAAPIEESLIWHEGVYQDLAINTATNIPAGWTFNPRSWMGSFSSRNILDRTCNQDGTMLYFRGLFASAAKPRDPTLGYSILHGRCAPDAQVRSCYVS